MLCVLKCVFASCLESCVNLKYEREREVCDRENILGSCICIVDIYCNVG